jgi:diguanylate cyclase
MGIIFSFVNYAVAHKYYKRYSSLKEENIILRDNIKVDKLTGLLNRRAFDNDIKRIEENELYSVIFVDIDNFREFNNRFGHQVGDVVLQNVCKVIKSHIRSKDKVYRYGGEEIVIILKDCGKSHAISVSEKIRHSISILDNSPYPNVTVSMGVASSIEDGYTINEVIRAADFALLAAKNKGKNCVVGYTNQSIIRIRNESI